MKTDGGASGIGEGNLIKREKSFYGFSWLDSFLLLARFVVTNCSAFLAFRSFDI